MTTVSWPFKVLLINWLERVNGKREQVSIYLHKSTKMSTIPDNQIIQLANRGLIDPFDESQVNPASYDVSLDPFLLLEPEPGVKYPPESLQDNGRWVKHVIDESGYVFKPGEFVLACTKESFNIPRQMEAVFQLKSSRGREGFEHVLSGYIDPGFKGRLTLELVNVNRFHDLLLVPGMLIGQIRFMKLAFPPTKDYSQTGHYHNDTNVQFSKVDVFGNAILDENSHLHTVSIDDLSISTET